MKCRTRNCRGHRTSGGRSPYCSRCRDRRFKAAHPIKWHYNSLKKHARLRGKPFSLTIEQFTEFAQKTDYVRLVGRSSLSLSIDRIENSLGYHTWNVRGVTLRENSRKQWVPYFNLGMSPQQRRDYLEAERAISEKMEKFAQFAAKRFGAGTAEFWKVVQMEKERLL